MNETNLIAPTPGQYTYTYSNGAKNYQIFWILVCAIGVLFFGYYLIRNIYILVTVSDNVDQFLGHLPTVLFTALVVFLFFLPILRVLLDYLYPIKKSRLQIKSKAVQLYNVVHSKNALFDYIASFLYRKYTSNFIDGRFTAKPYGWLFENLIINRQIYHALDQNNWVDVEYYPFTHTVRSIVIYKDTPYVEKTQEELTTIELANDFRSGMKYAILIIIGIIIIGLVYEFQMSSSEKPLREQWSDRLESKTIAEYATSRGIEPETIHLHRITGTFADGTLKHGLDNYNWLGTRNTATDNWTVVAMYKKYTKPSTYICTQYKQSVPKNFYLWEDCKDENK